MVTLGRHASDDHVITPREELERRGIRAVYRTVDIDDKGRWYRVYVGSFPSRAAANAAARDLKTVLDHDWVVPARF